MLRTAGRGYIVRETLKTHTTDHFMPLGILLASLILAAIRVSFENMPMQEYLDLRDSSFLTLWSEKELFFGKCKGNRVLCVKTWVVSFVLMRAHSSVFNGHPVHISDIIFLCWSA